MIEVLKQALEALYPISHNSTDDYRGQADKAITSLRQAIAKAEDNYQGSDAAKAAHMMDLYTALGVRWGDNPFAVIAKMRSIAELESQEPVAWVQDVEFEQLPEFAFSWVKTKLHDKPLFTHPPQRKPLTNQDIEVLQAISDEYNAWIRHHATGHTFDDFLAKREAAHGIKEQA